MVSNVCNIPTSCIEGHADIIAHLDGAQCLQHTKKQAFTDIVAHLEGVQCAKDTNELAYGLEQTL